LGEGKRLCAAAICGSADGTIFTLCRYVAYRK